MSLAPLIVGILAAFTAASSHAQWMPGGVQVCNGVPADGPHLTTDGQGGVFVGWRDSRGTNTDVYVQRLLSSGAIAPGWDAGGVPVCVHAGSQRPPLLLADASGGTYLVWSDPRDGPTLNTDLYASHVAANGTIVPGWIADGTPVVSTVGAQSFFDLATDGSGGMYVAWEDGRPGFNQEDIYAQRMLADGSIAPGWQSNGIPICTASQGQFQPAVVEDGSGGLYIGWTDFRALHHDAYVSRILSDGSLAPGWTADGSLILGGTGIQAVAALASDGEGGAYVGIQLQPDANNEDTRDLYLLRITGGGQIATGWPASGVPLCTAARLQDLLRLSPDSLGGVVAVWRDFRDANDDAYCTRVLPDGTIAPGWPVNGLKLAGPGSEFDPDVAADGLGGLFTVFQNTSIFIGIVAQHIAADGQVASGWHPAGATLGSGDTPRIIADGAGSAIVAWRQFSTIYAQKLVPDGPVPVLVSLVSSDATHERIRLEWHMPVDIVPQAAVYRRKESTSWRYLATIDVDGTRQLEYADHDITPGETYAYRLGWAEQGIERFSQESWIEVPAAFVLALEGLRPNPATGPLTIAFSLPGSAPGELELLDVTGRRVLTQSLNGFNAGRHVVRLGENSSLSPGMYFVRLHHGGQTLLARGAVVR